MTLTQWRKYFEQVERDEQLYDAENKKALIKPVYRPYKDD